MAENHPDHTSAAPCIYHRRRTISVRIGDTPLGAGHPIRVQSMATTSTLDTEASVAQAERIIAAGAEYLRYTAQDKRVATNLGLIHQELRARGIMTPLVADIHFNPTAADTALEYVEKVRVNPGNYVDNKGVTEWNDEVYRTMHEKVRERFGAFVERAKTLKRAIRIGVNHGSLSERMVMLYGDTPEGMVQSCLEYLDVCREHDFHDIVISMKSSNTVVMTAAVRLLVARLNELGYPAYPLHLGVTEAGEGEDGRIKSAVGIGSLLSDGIGDTIRVSLSEEPECEIPVARALVDYITTREQVTPPSDSSLLPSWEEYRRLTQDARKDTSSIGALVGGSNLPIVLYPTDKPLDSSSFTQRPDALLSPEGQLQIASGTSIVGIDVRRIATDALTAELLEELASKPQTLLLLESRGANPVADWRWGFTQLRRAGVRCPILLHRRYETTDIELFRLYAAADCGSIFLDGWGNGLALEAPHLPSEEIIKTEFGILQASRLRMSKTEFISCPGCGRTLYNLQNTIAEIKSATSHLKGLKVGIMGCIVNGPGEMADADYGYVGAAPGKIDLYKGQECIKKGVPQAQAVEHLIQLIKEGGDWKDPE
jgi:4-hydroxy-3-methylbut-2-en-1-yl diphosphate synthase